MTSASVRRRTGGIGESGAPIFILTYPFPPRSGRKDGAKTVAAVISRTWTQTLRQSSAISRTLYWRLTPVGSSTELAQRDPALTMAIGSRCGKWR